MCRCSDPDVAFLRPAIQNNRSNQALRIRAFSVKFKSSDASTNFDASTTTTLVYLPGVTDINGSKVMPGKPGLVPLHRTRSAELTASEAIFASTDRVGVREATRFEAYIGEARAVSGVFRRKGEKWDVECMCTSEISSGLSGVEVSVVGERGEVLEEKVELPVVGKRKGGRRGVYKKRFCLKLEKIAEEGEECECCGCCDGEEEEMVSSPAEEEEDDVDVEGVMWAVDVGIWLVCLGVGLLVSKTSSAPNRRRRNFLF